VSQSWISHGDRVASMRDVEGTGTWQDCLVKCDDPKNEGQFGKKIHQNREIVVASKVRVVSAWTLTQSAILYNPRTKYDRSQKVFCSHLFRLLLATIGRDGSNPINDIYIASCAVSDKESGNLVMRV